LKSDVGEKYDVWQWSQQPEKVPNEEFVEFSVPHVIPE
jgi:hypothetical protein